MAIDYVYSSDQISYGDSDVKSALDTLYDSASKVGDNVVSKIIWTGQVDNNIKSVNLSSYNGYQNFEVGKNIFFIPTNEGMQRNGGHEIGDVGLSREFHLDYNSSTGIVSFHTITGQSAAGNEYATWGFVLGSVYLVTIG